MTRLPIMFMRIRPSLRSSSCRTPLASSASRFSPLVESIMLLMHNCMLCHRFMSSPPSNAAGPPSPSPSPPPSPAGPSFSLRSARIASLSYIYIYIYIYTNT